MLKRSGYKIAILQLTLLLVFFVLGWHFLHRTPQISEESYAYLSGLSSEIILSSHTESRFLHDEAWSELIAVRSTIPLKTVGPILSQIKLNTPFKNINWGNLDPELINTVIYRKRLLINYPYYEPGRFTFPISGNTWYADTFGADREGGRRSHEGTDLFSPEGTPIISVSDGIIEKAGWNRLGGERVGVRGFDGNYYYYAHLRDIAPTIEIGNKVRKGEILGTMGHTGDALTTPDHLHFGIELPNGKWINPYPFLKVWEKESLYANTK